MDDDNVIEILESSPAYNREKKIVESLKNSDNSNAYPAQMPQTSSKNDSGNIEIVF